MCGLPSFQALEALKIGNRSSTSAACLPSLCLYVWAHASHACPLPAHLRFPLHAPFPPAPPHQQTFAAALRTLGSNPHLSQDFQLLSALNTSLRWPIWKEQKWTRMYISERSFHQTDTIGISKEIFKISLWSSPAIDTPVRGSDSQARVGTWGFQILSKLKSLLETFFCPHLCHCHCHCLCLCLMSTNWSVCCPALSWKPDGRHSGNFWGIGAGISGNRHQFPSAGLPPPTTS